jgi:hypothetical protein
MGLIFLSVAAGILIRNAFEKQNPTPSPTIATNADISRDLRQLSGVPQPDKLWATDFAAYASAHSGQWIVGRCKQPCLSEAEAASQARADAARSAWPVVLSRFGVVPSDVDWLQSRIDADVSAGRLDADKLAEKFDRPYGSVWTEAVLVDVSPTRIDSLMHSYKSDRMKFHANETRSHEVLLIGIAAAWMAYLLLNTITKGYFTMRLRIAAAVATVLGVALLV